MKDVMRIFTDKYKPRSQGLTEPHDVEANRNGVMKQTMMFSGNLAGDAEVFECKNGAKFIRFAVAVESRPVKDEAGKPIVEEGHVKTDAEWYRCQIYVEPGRTDQRADRLKRGCFVAAQAWPQVEAWLNKEHEAQGRIVWNIQRLEF